MIVDGLAEDNALFHSDEKGWAPLADQFLIVAPHVFRFTSRVVKTCEPPGFHFFACNTDIDKYSNIYIYIYTYINIHASLWRTSSWSAVRYELQLKFRR